MAGQKDGIKVLAKNKKASHEYFIEERYEAGLALQGTEVKSIRAGQVSMTEAYITIRSGEAWLEGMHISPYEQGNRANHDPLRPRKLLLHKKEISKLYTGVQQLGYTIIPLNIHLSKGRIKLDLALAKGKKLYDKRESLKRKEDERAAERAMRRFS